MFDVYVGREEGTTLMDSSGEVLWRRLGCYNFGLAEDLSEEELGQLVWAIERPSGRRHDVLGGRGRIAEVDLEGIGAVVVKHYTRGGLLRLLIENRYLRWGMTRPQIEFEIFRRAHELGVRVPEVVAFATCGTLFYRGWLITRAITDHRNLAVISLENEQRARHLFRELVEQVVILVENRIFHIDLHPGNVLVDELDQVHLVDFDKARYFDGSGNQLRDHYLCRWRRAVIKHRLPEFLSELMSAGLRRRFS